MTTIDAFARLNEEEVHALIEMPMQYVCAQASAKRDALYGQVITYSKKVFIPLTQLCRNVCHYCTFAQTPKKLETPYLSLDAVVQIAREGQKMGCREALFTLGELPELRYKAAEYALAEMDYASTLDYLVAAANRVYEETGLLPHVNPGCLGDEMIVRLKAVSASMGMMLETSSARLSEPGMPHYGSPDKEPARRLETLECAGRNKVPFTTGILIGIGETRVERIESLLAIRDSHERHGHIQEVIIQNFRAKPGTKMANADEPDLDDLKWTIAVARLIFGADVSIQTPPNLNPGVLTELLAAGLNDWGGVSPLTPDFVNPEAPWPHLDRLSSETRDSGKLLRERLTVYPRFIDDRDHWVDPSFHTSILRQVDSLGLPRSDAWASGSSIENDDFAWLNSHGSDMAVLDDLVQILNRAVVGAGLVQSEIVRLFRAQGTEVGAICRAADKLRKKVNGDTVTYVVNRNINYTNICYFGCRFCAFSKGKQNEDLRGKPYDIGLAEIVRRAEEAWGRGATEVCLQGGIHPSYTGQTYIDICTAIKAALPDMHIHAFSPLEVAQGAKTLGVSVPEFLARLKEAGLGSLPGTAAEILDDRVRAKLCPDKLDTASWIRIIEAAHATGLNTTATIMYGHIDGPEHWANHLLAIRDLQMRSVKKGLGRFTEFVPLPFVHMEAPMYLAGQARMGPTSREAVLMHAIARLVLHPHITNIQVSWTKMGNAGSKACLLAGVNDLGGTLMNESISRAAGAANGEEKSPEEMERLIGTLGRTPQQRATLYLPVNEVQRGKSFNAPELSIIRSELVKREKVAKRARTKLDLTEA